VHCLTFINRYCAYSCFSEREKSISSQPLKTPEQFSVSKSIEVRGMQEGERKPFTISRRPPADAGHALSRTQRRTESRARGGAPRRPPVTSRVRDSASFGMPDRPVFRNSAGHGTHLVFRFSTTRSTVISSSSTKSPMPTSSLAISVSLARSLVRLHCTARARRSRT